MSSANHIEKKRCTLDSGLEITYHDAGEGEVLLLIHGSGPGGSGVGNYEKNYAHFVEQGYRTLMPDVVGWGESSKPAGVDYDYPLVAGSLQEWLTALGVESCHIVGNSMGGALAIRLALENPGLVKSLILLAPAGLGDITEYMPMPGIQAIFGSMLDNDEITPEILKGVFELMYHDPGEIDMELVASRAVLANNQIKDTYKNYKLGNQADRLAELKCPILVFWGTSDRFCPIETASRIIDQCPSARLVTVPDCGHWVQVEQADMFNKLSLEFLQESQG